MNREGNLSIAELLSQGFEMRRVLLISDITGPGGVGTHLVQLASFGRSVGWDVRVLMHDCHDVIGISRELARKGVQVEHGPLYHGLHNEDVIRATVTSLIRHFKPDVVHVHCGSPRSAVRVRELVLEANLPLVITEHYVPSGITWGYSLQKRLAAIYQQASAVISVCEENRALLREAYALRATHHLVIRYPVLIPVSRRNYVSEELVRCITVARCVWQKGIDVLIRAVADKHNRIDGAASFTIVGGGPLESSLRHFAHVLGVSQKMQFLGWDDNVISALRSHDLFVLPSRSEGQPIALLEALADGLPCIAAAVSGIPEALGYGRHGELVPQEDPASLARAIARFATDPARLRERASSAIDYLRTHHDPDKNLGEIVEVWDSVRSS